LPASDRDEEEMAFDDLLDLLIPVKPIPDSNQGNTLFFGLFSALNFF
jgi:hypothetical protein